MVIFQTILIQFSALVHPYVEVAEQNLKEENLKQEISKKNVTFDRGDFVNDLQNSVSQKILNNGLYQTLSDIREKDDCDEGCKNLIFNFFGGVQGSLGNFTRKFTTKVFNSAAETLLESRLYERFKPRHNCIETKLEKDGYDKFCSDFEQFKVIYVFPTVEFAFF